MAVKFSSNCFGRFIRACILPLRLTDAGIKGIPIQKPTKENHTIAGKLPERTPITMLRKTKILIFLFSFKQNLYFLYQFNLLGIQSLTASRSDSCGTRKNHRAYADPRFFRPRRQKIFAVSPTGRAQIFCPLHKGAKNDNNFPCWGFRVNSFRPC